MRPRVRLSTACPLDLSPELANLEAHRLMRRALRMQLEVEPPRQLPQMSHLNRLWPREPRGIIDDSHVGDEAQQISMPAAEVAERALAPTTCMRAAGEHPGD